MDMYIHHAYIFCCEHYDVSKDPDQKSYPRFDCRLGDQWFAKEDAL